MTCFLQPTDGWNLKQTIRTCLRFSLEEIETSDRWHLNASTRDLHHDPSMNEGNIMTEYEAKIFF